MIVYNIMVKKVCYKTIKNCKIHSLQKTTKKWFRGIFTTLFLTKDGKLCFECSFTQQLRSVANASKWKLLLLKADLYHEWEMEQK